MTSCSLDSVKKVFMNFNVVIKSEKKSGNEKKLMFAVIALQPLFSLFGKNECNKWNISKDCLFVIFSLVIDWAFFGFNALFQIIS